MKILIIVPTYNEKETIGSLLQALRQLKRTDSEVLIVDDSSPDGTQEVVQSEAKKPGLPIYLLVGTSKQGLGRAYMSGFAWALKRDYDFVVSMDADFSHDPADLAQLLAQPAEIDIVIGSRYVPGGKIVGWNYKRQLNSRIANKITRLALGLKGRDVTAGFKRYSRRFLKSLDYEHIIASGYAFQVEMIYWAAQHKFTVTEVPITFVDRRVGESKISGELKRSAAIVWRLFINRRSVRQLGKFLVVGFFNAGLDWLIFFVLKLPLQPYGQAGKQLAKGGSFLVSGTSSYILNRRWTFRSTDARVARQATKFFIVAFIGLVLNNSIFYLVTSPTIFNQRDIVGLFLATALVTVWNFTLNKYWTFK